MGKTIFALRKISSLLLAGVVVWTSLTGCSRKLTDLQAGAGDLGFGYCDGTIGSFDVYVVRTVDLSKYELYVIPAQVAVPGELGNIAISNQSPSTLPLIPQVNFVVGQEILAGYLTDSDLATYDILSINQDDGSGRPIQDQTPERYADCYIPLPGQGTDPTGGTTSRGITRARNRITGSRRSLGSSKFRTRLVLK